MLLNSSRRLWVVLQRLHSLKCGVLQKIIWFSMEIQSPCHYGDSPVVHNIQQCIVSIYRTIVQMWQIHISKGQWFSKYIQRGRMCRATEESFITDRTKNKYGTHRFKGQEKWGSFPTAGEAQTQNWVGMHEFSSSWGSCLTACSSRV